MEATPTNNITMGTCLRFLGIIALVGLVGWYVSFQARNFIQGPSITLSDTYDPVQHEQAMPLVGEAQNIVKLTLNGKEIHTDEHGSFSQTLILEEGYTIMTLHAYDRFGRSTSLTREYVYVPS